MSEFFSSDGPYLLQFLVIFLVILILLMGAWLLFNRIVGRGLSRAARAGNRARQPRLGIVDIYELDRQRQLILLRRDNVEHLLLVGGPNDVVIERNVTRGAARLPSESVARPEPASDMAPDAAAPEARPALAPAAFEPTTFEPPGFDMPLVVPSPMSGANGQPGAAPASRPPPLDPALFEPEAEPGERPQAPAKSRIGIAQVGRILRRTPLPLAGERPEPASERARAGAPAELPTPPVMTPGEPRPVDPAVLSDMARQLETALRRQSSAVTPPPGQPAAAPPPPETPPPAPEPAEAPPPEPVRPPDPVAAGMAASQAPSPRPLAPAPPPPPEPPPPAAVPEPPKPPAPETKPPAQPGVTAFTVEEIETEFARLLGRPLDKKS